MLRLAGLCKTFDLPAGPLEILRDVTLALDAGEAVAIVGPSGSGKSTLLNIIGTLEPPTSGQYQFGETEPFELAPHALARFRNQHIGFVFQDHHLLPECSVLENVLLPTLAAPADRDVLTRALALLERVGLTERLNHRPATLSGGERQRVALARALINKPTLILADEPTGNLDQQTGDVVGDLLLELGRTDGRGLIVVTHAESLARRFSRCYTLDRGTLEPLPEPHRV